MKAFFAKFLSGLFSFMYAMILNNKSRISKVSLVRNYACVHSGEGLRISLKSSRRAASMKQIRRQGAFPMNGD